jgi:hypothetical protein
MLRLWIAALALPGATFIDRDAVIVDRVPLQIERYHSSLAPEKALAAWAASAPGAVSNPSAGVWRIASRTSGAIRETLQARADGRGGSELILARLDLRSPLAAPAQLPLSLPAGGSVLRAIHFRETGAKASQYLVSIPGGRARALAQLCVRALDSGWRVLGASDCAGSRGPLARWFMRGEETLGIEVRGGGRNTRVVMGHVAPRP